jgi:2,4-dichlorophenol 6-monooxygenase
VSLQNAMRMGEVYQALASTETANDALRTAIANQAEHFDMLGLQLGFVYESGALVGDGREQTAHAGSVREYVPNALPGARVPHAWVRRAGVRISTLDLFAYDRFTLVSGPAGHHWAQAGPIPIDHVAIGRDVADEDGQWMKLLGIDAGGAVLVRPDQHVAWRSRHGVADSVGTLTRALGSILAH